MEEKSRYRSRTRAWAGAALLLVFLLPGCAGLAPAGPEAAAFAAGQGAPVPLRLCIYKDPAVSMEQADRIVAALRREFAPFGLDIQVADVLEWQRPAFMHRGILDDVARRPLPPHADRALTLVGRDVRDFLWGVLLPEVLGAVETLTHTKGYVVAQTGSFNQLLTFQSPSAAAVHEFYHLLGCGHADDSRAVAEKIARLKDLAESNRRSGRDFFPGIDARGRFYFTRGDVEARFAKHVALAAGAAPGDREPRALP